MPPLRTYRREISGLDAPRAHPWTDAASCSGGRYLDLRASPRLVRTSLEDFTPWSGSAAVETFYRLLEWINAPDGVFESNDCEFTGPHADPEAAFLERLECSGRLMILFRDLPLNLSLPRVQRLEGSLLRALSSLDPEFERGAVGTTIMRTEYLGLPAVGRGRLGYQLMLSFWAWGDTEEETMANLDRLLRGLSRVLHEAQAT